MRKSEFQMLIFVQPVRRPSSLRHEFFFARKRVMVLSNASRREARNGIEQAELNKDMLRHRYTVNDAGSSARGLKFSEIC